MCNNMRIVMALTLLLWLISLPVLAQSDYVCGDANSDGQLNVGDAVFMINFVFKGGPAPDSICCEGCSEGIARLCYTGLPETQGIGQCAAGIQTCIDGEWGPCIGDVLPSTEICDGYDNDCDGMIDEDFNLGDPCTVGQGECQEWGVMVCKGDGTGTECSATAGSATSDICDGLDNDCDGMVDEDYNVGDPCSVGQGECQEWGVMVCKGDGTGTECSATAGSATTEVCDGLDNDCDGMIDDGYNVGDPCSVGVGECQVWGVLVCKADGTGTECNAVAGSPTTEICNDHLDNDCDGLIDEADPDCP